MVLPITEEIKQGELRRNKCHAPIYRLHWSPIVDRRPSGGNQSGFIAYRAMGSQDELSFDFFLLILPSYAVIFDSVTSASMGSEGRAVGHVTCTELVAVRFLSTVGVKAGKCPVFRIEKWSPGCDGRCVQGLKALHIEECKAQQAWRSGFGFPILASN